MIALIYHLLLSPILKATGPISKAPQLLYKRHCSSTPTLLLVSITDYPCPHSPFLQWGLGWAAYLAFFQEAASLITTQAFNLGAPGQVMSHPGF